MWDIQFNRVDAYNCFQNTIAAIAKYYDCSYQMVMLELLGFEYDHNVEGSVGDKLGTWWEDNFIFKSSVLEIFHGILLNIEHIREFKENCFKKFLTNSPVGIYVDCFDCSWLPVYRKQHRGHICLVKEIVHNKFLVIDEYLAEPKLMDTNFFFDINKKTQIITFVKKDKFNCPDRELYIQAIKNSISLYDERSTFSKIEHFVCDMKNNFCVSDEIVDTDDPISSKLMMNLKIVSDARLNFIEALEIIESKTEISFNDAKQILTNLSNEYMKLRNYIIKCTFRNVSVEFENIKQAVDKIRSDEHNFYQCLKNEIP